MKFKHKNAIFTNQGNDQISRSGHFFLAGARQSDEGQHMPARIINPGIGAETPRISPVPRLQYGLA
jgi:hypothetical protein